MTTVKFSNVMRGTPLNHVVYNFGDGTTISTSDQTVYHNYLLQGDYTFSLRAYSDTSSSQIVSYPVHVHP